ncbi:hypothetical protein [Paraburkholderia gardini]|uniref:Glucose-6-phosphate isomerase n=1 Tax=Paraburkholderia gardini TaxID=2823469 RepID=A0ABM8TYH8_9BURK|nr:hypothetical protein [Paraburkholderia gardini]CAG4888395.1 hypothetical protein R54767_00554 [Paraburkholderia gardini]CAG4891708.1 hypothetical protein R69919_01236 [Paraburkholderia gardini]
MLSSPSTLPPPARASRMLPDGRSGEAAPAVRTMTGTRPALRRPLRLPLALFGVTAVLLIAHQGRLVEIFFPLGAFLVALKFYRSSPAHYLGFVCWLFFLSPEVRRLADFMNGSFNPKSPVMVAPLIAVALSGLTLVTDFRALGQRRAAPLVMIMLALFYSFIVGMVQVGPTGAAYTLVNWLFPVLIAFQIVVTWREYPVYHRVLLKTFVFGGAVMGLYGVIQYVSPPPWDAFWLIASGMESEGAPVPFGMRICSTMNSAGPFAVVMMAVLLMAFAARGRMRVLMVAVGMPALMFTAVRSAWGGLIIGLIYPLMMLDGRSRMRLIGGVLGFTILCSPVVMIDQISDPLIKRFDTIQDLGNDNSYQVRAQFYKEFLSSALEDIAGQGLGTTGLGTKLSADDSTQLNVAFDSGLMEVPYVMGWPGTLLYVSGILILMWRAFRTSLVCSKDRFGISGVGVALAIVAMMVFVNTLTAMPGMFFFLGVIMPVIGLRYARESRGTAPSPAKEPS